MVFLRHPQTSNPNTALRFVSGPRRPFGDAGGLIYGFPSRRQLGYTFHSHSQVGGVAGRRRRAEGRFAADPTSHGGVSASAVERAEKVLNRWVLGNRSEPLRRRLRSLQANPQRGGSLLTGHYGRLLWREAAPKGYRRHYTPNIPYWRPTPPIFLGDATEYRRRRQLAPGYACISQMRRSHLKPLPEGGDGQMLTRAPRLSLMLKNHRRYYRRSDRVATWITRRHRRLRLRQPFHKKLIKMRLLRTLSLGMPAESKGWLRLRSGFADGQGALQRVGVYGRGPLRPHRRLLRLVRGWGAGLRGGTGRRRVFSRRPCRRSGAGRKMGLGRKASRGALRHRLRRPEKQPVGGLWTGYFGSAGNSAAGTSTGSGRLARGLRRHRRGRPGLLLWIRPRRNPAKVGSALRLWLRVRSGARRLRLWLRIRRRSRRNRRNRLYQRKNLGLWSRGLERRDRLAEKLRQNLPQPENYPGIFGAEGSFRKHWRSRRRRLRFIRRQSRLRTAFSGSFSLFQGPSLLLRPRWRRRRRMGRLNAAMVAKLRRFPNLLEPVNQGLWRRLQWRWRRMAAAPLLRARRRARRLRRAQEQRRRRFRPAARVPRFSADFRFRAVNSAATAGRKRRPNPTAPNLRKNSPRTNVRPRAKVKSVKTAAEENFSQRSLCFPTAAVAARCRQRTRTQRRRWYALRRAQHEARDRFRPGYFRRLRQRNAAKNKKVFGPELSFRTPAAKRRYLRAVLGERGLIRRWRRVSRNRRRLSRRRPWRLLSRPNPRLRRKRALRRYGEREMVSTANPKKAPFSPNPLLRRSYLAASVNPAFKVRRRAQTFYRRVFSQKLSAKRVQLSRGSAGYLYLRGSWRRLWVNAHPRLGKRLRLGHRWGEILPRRHRTQRYRWVRAEWLRSRPFWLRGPLNRSVHRLRRPRRGLIRWVSLRRRPKGVTGRKRLRQGLRTISALFGEALGRLLTLLRTPKATPFDPTAELPAEPQLRNTPNPDLGPRVCQRLRLLQRALGAAQGRRYLPLQPEERSSQPGPGQRLGLTTLTTLERLGSHARRHRVNNVWFKDRIRQSYMPPRQSYRHKLRSARTKGLRYWFNPEELALLREWEYPREASWWQKETFRSQESRFYRESSEFWAFQQQQRRHRQRFRWRRPPYLRRFRRAQRRPIRRLLRRAPRHHLPYGLSLLLLGLEAALPDLAPLGNSAPLWGVRTNCLMAGGRPLGTLLQECGWSPNYRVGWRRGRHWWRERRLFQWVYRPGTPHLALGGRWFRMAVHPDGASQSHHQRQMFARRCALAAVRHRTLNLILAPRRNNLRVVIQPWKLRKGWREVVFQSSAGQLSRFKGRLRRSPEIKRQLYQLAAFRLLRFHKKDRRFRFMRVVFKHYLETLPRHFHKPEQMRRQLWGLLGPFRRKQVAKRYPIVALQTYESYANRPRGYRRRSRKHVGRPKTKRY